MIGDIVGKPGRRVVSALVPGLRRELALDIVVANGENMAAGRGITPKTAKEVLAGGVDVITSGNHIWAQSEMIPYLESDAPILRPANYPDGVPGRGMLHFGGLTVINLMGRVFMYEIDDPFRVADRLLASVEAGAPVLVDMHAEASSEKGAMAWYLDGRVSAVVGTHTHVPTADARILPKGTAFAGDAGMCGPARLDHRRRGGAGHPEVPDGDAGALRSRGALGDRDVQLRARRCRRRDGQGARNRARGQGMGAAWRARVTSTRTARRPTAA